MLFFICRHTTWREVSNAISSINENVKSNIVDTSGALIEALIMFDAQYARADVPKAVFLITDTASTVNSDFLSDQTEVMRSEGIEVFPIGIGVRDKSELETIATNPRNVHTVSRYSDLSTLTNLLRRDIRSCKYKFFCFSKNKKIIKKHKHHYVFIKHILILFNW